jgi:hypothetical protein
MVAMITQGEIINFTVTGYIENAKGILEKYASNVSRYGIKKPDE